MAADDEGFEARLHAARLRQRLEPASRPPRPIAQGLGPALRIGVELVSALAVGLAIGWALDRWLHTRPLFLLLFLALGIAAGLLNVWRTIGQSAPPPG